MVGPFQFVGTDHIYVRKIDMNRQIAFSTIIGMALLVLAVTALAQNADACFVDRYQNIERPNTISQAEDYVSTIQRIIRACNQQSSIEQPGSGTFSDPYKYDTLVEAEAGLWLKVSEFTRGRVSPHKYYAADRGHEYVKVRVDVRCERASGAFCPTVSAYDMHIIGDNGEKYDRLYQTYRDEDELTNLELRPGSSGFGTVLYQVAAEDQNLLLIYEYGYGDEDYIVIGAEPSLEDAIMIGAIRNSNVRSGPGTSYGIRDGLTSGEQVAAIGRNADSSWIKTRKGWVFAELISTSHELSILPIVSE